MNLYDVSGLAHNEQKAFDYFETLRWPDGPECPHCGNKERIYDLRKTRVGLKKCGKCRKQFTARIGTIFEDSPIPIGKWMLAIFMMCNSKKGVSAAQIQRALGLGSYRSAWHLCHRIRLAMTQEPFASKLGSGGGIVEIDETAVGGKKRNNKHRNRTEAAGKKTVVMTLIDREGEARTTVVPNTKKGTLQKVAKPMVDKSATIVTDANPSYDGLSDHFHAHHAVDHSKEYVRAVILHTNFAESYHSLLKRGLIGAFHHVSQRHLPKYLNEFEFRWNRRKLTDGERMEDAITGVSGKRLMLKKPLHGPNKSV